MLLNLNKQILKIITFGFFHLLMLSLTGCPSDDNRPEEPIPIFTDFGRLPKWSPDGSTILFGEDTPGQSGLYLWSIEDDPVSLSDSLQPHNWDYCWSPDGDRIAFTSPGSVGDNLTGVWIYNIETNEAIRVFDRGRDVSWYSSGEALAVRMDNPTDSIPGIYRLDLTGEPDLETHAVLVIASGHKPVCSPAQEWLAYSDNEIRGRLRVIGSDGEEQYVSNPGVVQYNWSQDGSFLAFTINDYTTGSLEDVMWGVDIAQPELADTLARWAAQPAPDSTGNQVAFARSSYGRWVGVWLYSKSNDELKIDDYGLNPHFDPAGDRIAVNSTVGGIRIITWR